MTLYFTPNVGVRQSSLQTFAAQSIPALGRCRSRKLKINAAADLAHPSKAIEAMSKNPNAAAAM
jgi:hypothetical protein